MMMVIVMMVMLMMVMDDHDFHDDIYNGDDNHDVTFLFRPAPW